MQKRPTWATIVGVFGIVLASFGILGAGQTILMPKMMEFQKQIFSSMTAQIEKESANTQNTPQAQQSQREAAAMLASMQKMWNFPPWYTTWSIITGLLQLIIGGFYLFACIGLLQMKSTAIRMFYLAAGAKIVLGIANGVAGVMSTSFMAMAMMFGSAFGIIIHIVLLIVVATADKKAFASLAPQA